MIWLTILKYVPFLSKATGFFSSGKAKLIYGLLTLIGILGTGWYIDHLQNRIELMEKDKRTLSGYLDDCQKANVKYQLDFNTVSEANRQLAETLRVSDQDNLKALNDARRRAAESEERLANTTSELERLRNEEPTCAQIANLDIAAACPAAVERLREQASN